MVLSGARMRRSDTYAIRNFEEFPGWASYPAFLETFLKMDQHQSVLDIGGGANPMIDANDGRKITYDLLDISQAELDKAPKCYHRLICADATMPQKQFESEVGRDRYDLIYSHMFMEHIRNPDRIHRNLFSALKPGGVCVHAYPTNRNIPLALNSLLPETVSRGIVRIVQPSRDLEGKLGKFPAFYKNCFGPSRRSRSYFEGFGYEVLVHHGFAGHQYYYRLPVLRELELLTRRVAVAMQVNWICFNLVVLKKPLPADAN